MPGWTTKLHKHILRAAEYLRDLVLKGVVTLSHLSGVLMVADILTKAVSRSLFRELLDLINTVMHAD